MSRGVPFYSQFGLLKSSLEAKVRIGETYRDIRDLEEPESIWSQTEIDLSGRPEITGVEISLVSRLPVEDDCGAYNWAKFLEYFEFVLCISNTSSRTRSCTYGSINPITHKGSRVPVRYEGVVSGKTFDLSEFSGEIKIEPVFVVRRDDSGAGIIDPISRMRLLPGTVVAFCDPIRIVLDRDRRGLSNLFEFVWREFSKDTEFGLPPSGLFSVGWEENPKLFMNLDVEYLETILTSEARVGALSAARDSINLVIAHQVLTTVIDLIVQKLVRQREISPDDGVEELVASLSSSDRQFLSSWFHVLDPKSTPHGSLENSIENLLDLESDQLEEFVTKAIPNQLQLELASQKSIEKLISVFDRQLGGDTND
jgi:hypothetical protein